MIVPICILILVGALAGTWLISGIIPAMVYYGLQVLSPEIFLPASVIIAAIISIATVFLFKNRKLRINLACMALAYYGQGHCNIIFFQETL